MLQIPPRVVKVTIELDHPPKEHAARAQTRQE
jgi:hypothetical protein